MRSAVALLVLVAAAAATEFPTFEQFCTKYNRQYEKGSEEYFYRMQLYNLRVQSFRAHNLDTTEHRLGVNEFADYADSELASMRGYKGAARLQGMSTKLPPVSKDVAAGLPASVDWTAAGMVTPVKNQGQCGSCWAFGSVASVESAVAIKTKKLMSLSEQEFVSCCPNPRQCGGLGGCQGATPDVLFAYAMKNGFVLESDYPYTSGNGQNYTCQLNGKKRVAGITGFMDVNSNDDLSLMAAVAQQPVAVNVDASQWSFYSGGILKTCTWIIDHVVLLVGYGTDNGQNYWLIKNSWGASWGENGYIRLARTANGGTPICGTNTDPSQGVGCAGGPPTEHVCGTCGILYAPSYPTGAHTM